MNNFWRVMPPAGRNIEHVIGTTEFAVEPTLAAKLKRNHGILLANWHESTRTGQVLAMGIVLSVDGLASANVLWVGTNLALRPSPAGERYWRAEPFFKFAATVAVQYKLRDIFAKNFPGI